MKTLRLCLRYAATCGILTVASSLRVDAAEKTSLRIIQTEEARFPSGLLLVPITHGDAWVMITVDETGRLTDAMVTRFTHEAFADEAARVLRRWKYEPIKLDGIPTPTRIEVHFEFEASGAVISLDSITSSRSHTAFAEKPQYHTRVCSAHELDQQPIAVKTVTPELATQGRLPQPEKFVIDFIIDETGTPRMPVLISSPNEESASRIAHAITQWQFTPPTRRGRPVAVRVQQAFLVVNGS